MKSIASWVVLAGCATTVPPAMRPQPVEITWPARQQWARTLCESACLTLAVLMCPEAQDPDCVADEERRGKCGEVASVIDDGAEVLGKLNRLGIRCRDEEIDGPGDEERGCE